MFFTILTFFTLLGSFLGNYMEIWLNAGVVNCLVLLFIFFFLKSFFSDCVYYDVPQILTVDKYLEVIFYADLKLYTWKPIFKKNTYMEYFSNNIFWNFK